MKNILLCTSDPLLIKNLYGVLRDAGYTVDTVEHPALAVRKVFSGTVDALIVGSDPFGLSVEDAVQIIRAVEPDLPVIRLGEASGGPRGAGAALDLEQLKSTIHGIAV